MALILELTPRVQTWLQEEAQKAGLSVEMYAITVLEQLVAQRAATEIAEQPRNGSETKEEQRQAFLKLVKSLEHIDAPPIPSEALRRENMYEDRGL
jgi:hypothetical protein